MMRNRLTLLAIVTLTLTGCIYTGHVISDDELEQWQATSEQTLAKTSEIEVYVQDVVCMVKCGEDLHVDAYYATYQDMVDDEAQAVALQQLMEQDSSQTTVRLQLRPQDTEDVKKRASTEILAAMGGDLTVAQVRLAVPYMTSSGIAQAGYISLSVADDVAVTPELLSASMDAAAAATAGLDVPFALLGVYTADEFGRTFTDHSYDDPAVAVRGLEAFTNAATGDCVVHGNWAFDMTEDRLVPYPVDDPGGACA